MFGVVSCGCQMQSIVNLGHRMQHMSHRAGKDPALWLNSLTAVDFDEGLNKKLMYIYIYSVLSKFNTILMYFDKHAFLFATTLSKTTGVNKSNRLPDV